MTAIINYENWLVYMGAMVHVQVNLDNSNITGPGEKFESSRDRILNQIRNFQVRPYRV